MSESIPVMLGGVPIIVEAGAVTQNYSGGADGRALIRLSEGELVGLRHWRKYTITLSGSGWVGVGLDGLDYDTRLELRCTKPLTITGLGTTYSLTTDPRPDVAPWADALVGDRWMRTPVSMAGRIATIEPYDGATYYRLQWMPVFIVYADPPEETSGGGAGGSIDWTITAQET